MRLFRVRPDLFLPRGMILGMLCALAALLLSRSLTARMLEDWASDWCFAARGTRPSEARDKIILVGIDDDSLDVLDGPMIGISPPMAKVVSFLSQSGAKVIGVDMILVLPKNSTDNFGADQMGEAVEDAGNVMLAAAWRLDHRRKPLFVLPTDLWSPLPDALGAINLEDDPDHFIRRQRLVYSDRSTLFPQFDLAVFARTIGGELQPAADMSRSVIVNGKPLTLPLERDGTLRINYVGPPDTFEVKSFRSVLKAAESGAKAEGEHDFKGKVVLIGTTAKTQRDYQATPYSNRAFRISPASEAALMCGLEIHANTLATLLDSDFIIESPAAANWIAVLVVGALLGIGSARVHLGGGVGLTFVHHFAWKLIALAAFAWFRLRVPMIPMFLTGFLVFPATFAIRWWWLRRMFGIVKSRSVVRAIEEKRLDSEGEQREVTVLFSDIRGFTSYSSTHDAKTAVGLLNDYFAEMVPIVERRNGTIDKFIGDGLMVLFNAPDAMADHAQTALLVAVEMVRRVRARRADWESSKFDFKNLTIGIGIHTGKAIIGPIGSPLRVDFTAIGDTVNKASRLESENKTHDTEILISEQTRACIPAALLAELGCSDTPLFSDPKGLGLVKVFAVRPS